jgi:alpha-1,6-mannosyltransferase
MNLCQEIRVKHTSNKNVLNSVLQSFAKFFRFKEVNVHIDVYSAQTGISRFLEINRNSGWIYNKTENLMPGSTDIHRFTHLLIEADSETHANLAPYKMTHTILNFVKGFNGMYFAPTSNKRFLWPKFNFAPKIYILKKNEFSS